MAALSASADEKEQVSDVADTAAQPMLKPGPSIGSISSGSISSCQEESNDGCSDDEPSPTIPLKDSPRSKKKRQRKGKRTCKNIPDEGKQPKQKTPQPTQKKSRMKTATEVKDRILWDANLPSQLFTLGYEDRFTGIVEKPFDSFNWADYCSLSHVETAIPKHRIAYFKYKDTKVWDKSTRLDNVFGSTGGITIDAAMTIIDAAMTTIDATPENNNDCEAAIDRQNDSVGTMRQYKADLNRPNSFVAFRITNPSIIAAAQGVLRQVIETDPRFAAGATPLKKLHFTLVTLRIDSDEDRILAANAVCQARALMNKYFPNGTSLRVVGIGCFRDRVLHARLHPIDEARLQAFQKDLRDCFLNEGVRLAGEHGTFTPHMTLLKFDREMSRSIGRMDPTLLYKSIDQNQEFGSQAVDGVELCSMGKSMDPDGFYVRLFPTIQNELLLPTTWGELVPEVLNRVGENHHLVIIMRGIPGSGKSTVAKYISDYFGKDHTVVCSADDFFVDSKGVYRYNRTQLGEAHSWCQHRFAESLCLYSNQCIIVDNTNITFDNYEVYLAGSQQAGWPCLVLETTCASAADLELCYSRGKHGVPMDTLESMFWRFAAQDGALRIDLRSLRSEINVNSRTTNDIAVPERIWTHDPSCSPTVLYIFDFDGTLCKTAGSADGIAQWEDKFGTKWDRNRNWLSCCESLRAPCNVASGPALSAWSSYAGRLHSRSVILSGRDEVMRGEIEVVLSYMLPRHPDVVILKPKDCTMSTADFKIKMLKKLLRESTDVQEVNIWDDNARNLSAMRSYGGAVQRGGGPTFSVHDAKELGTNVLSDDIVKLFVSARGWMRPAQSRANAEYAICRIAAVWFSHCKSEGFIFSQNCKATDLCLLYGSYCFGRNGDIDLCLQSPRNWNRALSVSELESKLQAQGISSTYIAHSSRCPLLKVELYFEKSTPLAFDITFAAVMDLDGLPKSIASHPLGGVTFPAGTDGPAYTRCVCERLDAVGVSPIVFGTLIDLTVNIIQASNLKGNHFHGIRTCHVVDIASLALCESRDRLCDAPVTKLFRLFVSKAASMTSDEWEKLCSPWVPHQLLLKCSALWRSIEVELSEKLVSFEYLDYLCAPKPFPGDSRIAISVQAVCQDDPHLAWQLDKQLRGRMPTAFRAILDADIDALPGPDVLGHMTFSLPDSSTTRNLVSDILSGFVREFLPYRAKGARIDILVVHENVSICAGEPLGVSAELSHVLRSIRDYHAGTQVDSMEFDALSADDRYHVHRLCEQLGLKSHSVGEGLHRSVIVFKNNND